MKNHINKISVLNKLDSKSFSFPKISDKLHSDGRETLVWFSRMGGTRVKSMSDEHIRNVKNHINEKTTDIKRPWCGHSKKMWDYVLNKELQYRERRGDAIIGVLKKIFFDSKLMKKL